MKTSVFLGFLLGGGMSHVATINEKNRQNEYYFGRAERKIDPNAKLFSKQGLMSKIANMKDREGTRGAISIMNEVWGATDTSINEKIKEAFKDKNLKKMDNDSTIDLLVKTDNVSEDYAKNLILLSKIEAI